LLVETYLLYMSTRTWTWNAPA